MTVLLLTGLALLPSSFAAAQAVSRPGDERPPIPPFEHPDDSTPVLPSEPEPEPPEPEQPIYSEAGVFVSGYRIAGSTVFSDEELEEAVSPWSNRTIRSEDLVSVRNALTQLYVSRGYLNSGAILEDQDLEGGLIEVRIIEGRLSEIRISGNEQFRERYLRDRLARGAHTPLNVRALERQLQLLQQDDRVERVIARLAPGRERGEAILHVQIVEARLVDAAIRFSNYEPASLSAEAGQFEGSIANPSGWGDFVQATYTQSKGIKRAGGYYEVPVTRWDTMLSFDGRYSDARVTESPFDQLDITSQFQSYHLGIRQPIYTSPRTWVDVGMLFGWRRNETNLLGEPFSFPGTGANEGEATTTVLRFVIDWLTRDQRQVFGARSQISVGIDALDSTINTGNRPDSEFVSWLLQVQWARRFALMDLEAIFRTDLQLSNAPLLSMEQIAVGGYATVRGYRQNQYVRDQAVISSLELRIPILHRPDFGGTIILAPFVDFGYAWDHDDRLDPRSETLASVGIGVRWRLSSFLEARVYWGQNLTSVDTFGDLQDKGVQFLINAHLP